MATARGARNSGASAAMARTGKNELKRYDLNNFSGFPGALVDLKLQISIYIYMGCVQR